MGSPKRGYFRNDVFCGLGTLVVFCTVRRRGILLTQGRRGFGCWSGRSRNRQSVVKDGAAGTLAEGERKIGAGEIGDGGDSKRCKEGVDGEWPLSTCLLGRNPASREGLGCCQNPQNPRSNKRAMRMVAKRNSSRSCTISL